MCVCVCVCVCVCGGGGWVGECVCVCVCVWGGRGVSGCVCGGVGGNIVCWCGSHSINRRDLEHRACESRSSVHTTQSVVDRLIL